MRISMIRKIAIAIVLSVSLLLPVARIPRADDKQEDIDFICQKEREIIESQYQANELECKAYSEQYSVQRFENDPQVIQAAEDSTKQEAWRESVNWPPEREGWWIFRHDKPSRLDPWNDPRFDYNRYYQSHLQRLAEEKAKPYQENVSLKTKESDQNYKQALEKLEQECQRRKDLHQDFLKEEAQRKRQRETAETRKALEKNVKADNNSLQDFIDNIEDQSPIVNTAIMKPGRFDSPRKRWDYFRIKKIYNPKQCADSVDSMIIKDQESHK